jgi:acetoin utilization protein AcuB
MLVRERMTAPVITIHPDHRFHDALHLMQEKNLHHLPVVNKAGTLVGVVAERDLLMAAMQFTTQGDVEVADLMHRDVVTTTAEMTIRDAAAQMLTRRIGCLPVLDDDAVIGIITETDMLQALVEMLA